MAESKKTAPISDVAHPGKTAPSPNSKSVIVGHRPIMSDPMMVAGETAETDKANDSKATRPTGSSTGNVTLQPLSAPPLAAKKPKKADASKTVLDKAADATPDPPQEDNEGKTTDRATSETLSPKRLSITPLSVAESSDPEDSEAENRKDDSTTKEVEVKVDETAPAEKADLPELKSEASIESAPVNSPESAEANNKPQTPMEADAAQAALRAEHDKTVEKLIDGKKYYLPINSVEKRRTKRVIILGVLLCILLAIAWVDIALDAGLIDLGGIKPVTHFFSS